MGTASGHNSKVPVYNLHKHFVTFYVGLFEHSKQKQAIVPPWKDVYAHMQSAW